MALEGKERLSPSNARGVEATRESAPGRGAGPDRSGNRLQQQLAKAGIASHTETRMQLGPFKDKHEAEKALAQAIQLGINAVLLPPRQ
jgi:cell division protein FtsN